MQDEVSNEQLEHFLDIIMSPAVMTDAPLVLLFYKAVFFFFEFLFKWNEGLEKIISSLEINASI